MSDPRRELPSVNALLAHERVRSLLDRAPRTVVTEAVRVVIDRARGDPAAAPRDAAEWASAVEAAVVQRQQPSLRPVYNATGVVLHTNLGRAPLADAAIAAIRDTAAGYSTLEYDLERGRRGSRSAHCVELLRELTGAEDALVANNCAAALVLTLNTLAVRREALVSRGELIEIGGSFRVPSIMAKSGARLVEVGTTNRTYVHDYAAAITTRTGAIVKVHRSNFAVSGFVAEASLGELAALARDRGLPLLHDFGSGLLIPLDRWGLAGEPIARDAVAAGASVVVMSGDKLLGGPQAGVIVGDAALVARLRSNPLMRALRVDKLTLAALEATLMLYRDPSTAVATVPVLSMLTATAAAVRQRADAAAARLRRAGVTCDVIETVASVGGGAFPTARIASAAVAIRADATGAETRLRRAQPAVIGRLADGAVLLDLRTVPADHDRAFVDTVARALVAGGG